MKYIISEKTFKDNFNWKSTEEKSADSLRITHTQDQRFHLFPYKASGKTASPLVVDMTDVIGDFFKDALGVNSPDTSFEHVWEKVLDEVDVESKDEDSLKKVISTLFYKNDEFIADNIGLYAFQGKSQNKSAARQAQFLRDVFAIDYNDAEAIRLAMKKYPYNALERLMTECLGTKQSESNNSVYFRVFDDASIKFKHDFHFMLANGMTSPEDLSNLMSLYYLYYTAQTCIMLDHFGSADRNDPVEIYFALDWEKVSANRKCCSGGWRKLQENVSHIFSHAVTLELLNQTEEPQEMLDYKKIADYISEGIFDDHATAVEVKKIENLYTDAVGDYQKFDQLQPEESFSETDSAIRHLFNCVLVQFQNTERKRANDSYIEKLTEFYRYRWLKNRRKSGLVFNLTESDIIFLTKISIQNKDRIRLVDLFKEYETRGIFLDNTSKTLLQEFFTKLNLLDKKSDSGDAQYVKRIL